MGKLLSLILCVAMIIVGVYSSYNNKREVIQAANSYIADAYNRDYRNLKGDEEYRNLSKSLMYKLDNAQYDESTKQYYEKNQISAITNGLLEKPEVSSTIDLITYRDWAYLDGIFTLKYTNATKDFLDTKNIKLNKEYHYNVSIELKREDKKWKIYNITTDAPINIDEIIGYRYEIN